MSDEQEVFPFVVCRVMGEQFECALWPLEDGSRALALFLTHESAQAYLDTAELEGQWKIYQPQHPDLMQILRQSQTSGIGLVALDPDPREETRLFDLAEIVRNSSREDE